MQGGISSQLVRYIQWGSRRCVPRDHCICSGILRAQKNQLHPEDTDHAACGSVVPTPPMASEG